MPIAVKILRVSPPYGEHLASLTKFYAQMLVCEF